jgi:hypothetical protein
MLGQSLRTCNRNFFDYSASVFFRIIALSPAIVAKLRF